MQWWWVTQCRYLFLPQRYIIKQRWVTQCGYVFLPQKSVIKWWWVTKSGYVSIPQRSVKRQLWVTQCKYIFLLQRSVIKQWCVTPSGYLFHPQRSVIKLWWVTQCVYLFFCTYISVVEMLSRYNVICQNTNIFNIKGDMVNIKYAHKQRTTRFCREQACWVISHLPNNNGQSLLSENNDTHASLLHR